MPMGFAEVEDVIGNALPSSARRHRPWWGNEPTGHSHAQAWTAAGFRAERVDMEAERVVFVRGRPTAGRSKKAVERHPLLGSLKGAVRIAPGVDLTQPADPGWGGLTEGTAGGR